MPNLLDRYEGAIFWHAIWDSIWAPFECEKSGRVSEMISEIGGKLKHVAFFRPYDKDLREKESPDNLKKLIEFPAGFWTDDTSQMLCIAQSLIDNWDLDIEDVFKRFKDWFNDDYMVPLNFRRMWSWWWTRAVLSKEMKSMDELNGQEEYWMWDGSLMRTLPIWLAYHWKYSDIEEKSRLSWYITHNNKIASWCCICFNTLVSLILDWNDKEWILNKVVEIHWKEIPKDVVEILLTDYTKIDSNDLDDNFIAPTALKNALWAFQTSESFEEAIERCIRIWWDTDTYAAILWWLVGAYYWIEWIPEGWLSGVINDKDFSGIANNLLKFNQKL